VCLSPQLSKQCKIRTRTKTSTSGDEDGKGGIPNEAPAVARGATATAAD
jgi:hypothetical protein